MEKTLVLDEIAETLSDQLWSHTPHRYKLIYMSLLFKPVKLSFLLVAAKNTVTHINIYHEPDMVLWATKQSQVGISLAL